MTPGEPAVASLQVSLGAVRLPSGIELHFVQTGQGPPVIFMHGGMGDCHSWRAQLEAFGCHFRALAYSRRLHSPNRNPVPAHHPSLAEEAGDLLQLQSALGIAAAHLVATSYGALVALAYAMRHPTRVRSLVLAEPPMHRWAASTRRGEKLLDQFMADSWLPARRAFERGMDDDAVRRLMDGMWGRAVYDAVPPARREAARRNATAMKLLTQAHDPFPDLPRSAVARLPVPVLLIRGADTSALHKLGLEELAAVLPSSRQEIVDEAGHASAAENPVGFNSAVLRFLSNREVGAASGESPPEHRHLVPPSGFPVQGEAARDEGCGQ